jgi:hypothetical protein
MSKVRVYFVIDSVRKLLDTPSYIQLQVQEVFTIDLETCISIEICFFVYMLISLFGVSMFFFLCFQAHSTFSLLFVRMQQFMSVLPLTASLNIAKGQIEFYPFVVQTIMICSSIV